MTNILISAKKLYLRLKDEDLVILDTSANANVSIGSSKYQNVYIPNSRKYDIKENFSDTSSPLPNTFPSIEQLELEYRKLGINKSSTVVIYDNIGVHTSPRGWWMLRVAGHDNVLVLDGGLPAWIACGYEVTDQLIDNAEIGNFEVKLDQSRIKSYDDVRSNIDLSVFLILDARSEGRFAGVDKEPRKHLKSGCIPGSVNIPYKTVLKGGKFKTKEELAQIFKSKVTDEIELVFSCGSGITACIILLAYELIGDNKTAVFDGSWTEWAEKQGLLNSISS